MDLPGTDLDTKTELALAWVQMRTDGYSYQQIGDRYGVHPRTVSNAIEKAYDAVISPSVNVLRNTLTDQAFVLIQHFMPKAKDGDVRSAELVLKCIERVSKMHGVEKEININVGDGANIWERVYGAVLVEDNNNNNKAIEAEVIDETNSQP